MLYPVLKETKQAGTITMLSKHGKPPLGDQLCLYHLLLVYNISTRLVLSRMCVQFFPLVGLEL